MLSVRLSLLVAHEAVGDREVRAERLVSAPGGVAPEAVRPLAGVLRVRADRECGVVPDAIDLRVRVAREAAAGVEGVAAHLGVFGAGRRGGVRVAPGAREQLPVGERQVTLAAGGPACAPLAIGKMGPWFTPAPSGWQR